MNSKSSSAPQTLPPELRFLTGGGEATRLILGREWSAHPLGEPAGWPDILKTSLSLILNSPESMILAWGETELTFFFNEAYFPLLGPRVAWAMGSPFQMVWPDAWEQAKPIIDDAFAGRSQRFTDLPWKLDTDRGRADTWFSFSYSRVLDPHGAIAGVFIFTNETTERVLSDAALRQSEERLRLVIEGAKDHVIFTTDPGGIVTTWSAGAEAVLGWTVDEALGRSAAMIFTPEDRASGDDVRELAGAARDGCAADERWHLRRDGSRVFLTGSVHPLPVDAQGQLRGFIRIARDETQRWQAQRDLETLNATLEQQVAARTADRNRLWQLSADLMLVANFDGSIEAVNPAWTRILGWLESELVGAALFSLIHPDDFDHTVTGASSIASGGTYARFENRYRHKDGSYRDIVWAAGPGDDRIIAVGRDATEEKAQARALADAEQQLRQSQKMEAVGQLTGGLAHDFNNLLTAVTGGLELLGARVARGEYDQLDRYVSMAQTGANRAAALTQRLLAFSRRQTLAPTPTDADRLIAGMEEIIDRTLGPAIEMNIVATAGLWPVLVDAPQLENALLNLCINARDAMPAGGRLTIETNTTRLDARAAADQDLPEGEYVSLCVTDTGTGMTPEIIERVFDPFFTTKPIGEGTGLGLSMIYGFVRQSGGQVRIHSQIGQGTTMCLYLPRHRGEVTADDRIIDAGSPVRAIAGETVLIVEDEIAIRQLVAEVLVEAGYRVLEASNGPGGVAVLRSDERIDLLITDVGLPGGLNGRQVADAGRAVRPMLKVLFVTGYAANAAVGAGHLEEGMEVLTKPFNIADLEQRIRRILASETSISGDVRS
ncbi:PAS domain S-box protein [Sphingomonas sp. OK281]|uniref:PAS domain S-box protein n=1 Tax=Sphingomonas sp. OK281 TaxID=1881067 RepID=UPI0008E7E723|nr:PAS domain S-box protein [Sphingomonas sp. OK281]SFO30019.1 PAS domain S-box-containing protein [Sphingomonas sp. OK281]